MTEPQILKNWGMEARFGELETGVLSYQTLRQRGLSRRKIENAVQDKDLIKLRRGWYANAQHNALAAEAVRRGGAATCFSACEIYGLWTPRHRGIHVAVGRGHRWHSTRDCSYHVLDRHQYEGPVVPLNDCLLHVVKYHDPESALVVIESALNLKRISRADVEEILALASVSKGKVLQYFSELSQSGSESRVALFLRGLKFEVVQQVWILGVGRVDIVVDNWLIIECDSREFHTQEKDYETDRARDLAAKAAGYRVVRLSFRQIWSEWDETKNILLKILKNHS